MNLRPDSQKRYNNEKKLYIGILDNIKTVKKADRDRYSFANRQQKTPTIQHWQGLSDF
jgi:hypothetical protein